MSYFINEYVLVKLKTLIYFFNLTDPSLWIEVSISSSIKIIVAKKKLVMIDYMIKMVASRHQLFYLFI